MQAELCDNIVMIHNGQKVLDDPLDKIRSRFDPKALLIEPMDRSIDETRLTSIAGVDERTVDAGWELVLEDGLAPSEAARIVPSRDGSHRGEAALTEDIFIQIVQDDSYVTDARAGGGVVNRMLQIAREFASTALTKDSSSAALSCPQ